MSQKKATSTLLFDLDGTLVDTDVFHLKAYNTLLQTFDRQIDEDYYKTHVMGFSNDEIMRKLFPAESSNKHAQYANQKEEIVRSLFTDLTPTPGLLELLQRAELFCCRMAVVTNAPRQNAELLLSGLRLQDRFKTVVLGEELTHGKPHPLPYLTALELLGARAENAFAFEDSYSGVKSASSAGLRTFGLLTSLPESKLLEAGAVRAIRDFLDPTMRAMLYPLFDVEAPELDEHTSADKKDLAESTHDD